MMQAIKTTENNALPKHEESTFGEHGSKHLRSYPPAGIASLNEESRICESELVALTQAIQNVSAALVSGAMTLTELEGSGAILMLAKRDEMLTINASATWLVARLQAPYPLLSANELSQKFAAQFGITELQAEHDAHLFLTHLAQQLI
jgi:hypothetical protein